MEHCCEAMMYWANHTCAQHPDLFECPDHLVHFDQGNLTYGLIIHDGGSSVVSITHCPWCGSSLMAKQRD